jgi:hypothetical protein
MSMLQLLSGSACGWCGWPPRSAPSSAGPLRARRIVYLVGDHVSPTVRAAIGRATVPSPCPGRLPVTHTHTQAYLPPLPTVKPTVLRWLLRRASRYRDKRRRRPPPQRHILGPLGTHTPPLDGALAAPWQPRPDRLLQHPVVAVIPALGRVLLGERQRAQRVNGPSPESGARKTAGVEEPLRRRSSLEVRRRGHVPPPRWRR